jgi:hypothetical protein
MSEEDREVCVGLAYSFARTWSNKSPGEAIVWARHWHERFAPQLDTEKGRIYRCLAKIGHLPHQTGRATPEDTVQGG